MDYRTNRISYSYDYKKSKEIMKGVYETITFHIGLDSDVMMHESNTEAYDRITEWVHDKVKEKFNKTKELIKPVAKQEPKPLVNYAEQAMPQPEEIRKKTEQTLRVCAVCGTALRLSKNGKSYYCPNFKKKKLGEHTRIPVQAQSYEQSQNTAPQFSENEIIPF